MSKSTSKNATRTIEERYKKKSQHEHVLSLPDTYIGGIEEDKNTMWVFDSDEHKMVFREINYNPGLYKIFDEIIVNARDQVVRDNTCKTIKVDIDKDTGMISCYNDGMEGVPVAIHKEHKVYVPELIFGNLLTSENYEEKGKITGGKNGLGAKLTNIYSKQFVIEVLDAKAKKLYKQNFYDNMYKVDKPEISNAKGKMSYIKISFKPDYERFGMETLTDDMIALFKKRVYDINACSKPNTKVYLNGTLLEKTCFKDYVTMHYPDDNNEEESESNKIVTIYEEPNDRWKVCAIYDSNSGYRHISYVNGISTFQGGSHVNHVMSQIVNGLNKYISEKNKTIKIRPSHIKDNLTVFIDSVIEDPGFSSQTKEFLTSKVEKFGSRCELTDDFIKRLAKTGIVDEIVNFAKLKAMAEMKKTDGKKTKSVKGINKLDDARFAGTAKSKECRLILTEGDSAKTFATSGLNVIGRDYYGVFPLKGKLLNVREATAKQLLTNEEIKNIKQIMGLKHDTNYDDVSKLRYGGIILLTDQDVDGYHIKGLLMNFIHYFWPSLVKIDGFVQSMATPIIKVWKKTDVQKKNVRNFYTLTEYEKWKTSTNPKLWNMKYYKGLGTHSAKEAQECFNDFEKRVITYIWSINNDVEKIDDEIDIEDEDETDDAVSGISESYKALMLAFSKNKSNDRKTWLQKYDPNDILENTQTQITYTEFVNKELKHFSNYDNHRSIACIGDGLKPSQRKILYGSILRKLFTKEIRVAQLAGSVSETTNYHHGENSLQEAIVGMAQNFIGSNNLNLLIPDGGFGSRRQGGKDHASARYIHTKLTQLVRNIFREEDECILDYVNDDGTLVEPETYAPIIPTVLINGTKGIGTGFSTDIPCFNPLDIVKNIRLLINGKPTKQMTPWYRGFKGTITKLNHNTFLSEGKYEILSRTKVKVTEIPIGIWTDDYNAELDKMVADDPKNPGKKDYLKEVLANPGINRAEFEITFLDGELQKLIKSGELSKVLKLTKNIKTSNMHLHTPDGKIKKYQTVDDILRDFYKFRLEQYVKRKERYLIILENILNLIKYKVMFLEFVINGKIVVFQKNKAIKKTEIIAKLEALKFPKLHTDAFAPEEDKSYSYITSIPLFSLTEEELEQLKKKNEERLMEYETYKNTTVEQIWLNELDEFEKAYHKWINSLVEDDAVEDAKKTKGKKGKNARKSASKH